MILAFSHSDFNININQYMLITIYLENESPNNLLGIWA